MRGSNSLVKSPYEITPVCISLKGIPLEIGFPSVERIMLQGTSEESITPINEATIKSRLKKFFMAREDGDWKALRRHGHKLCKLFRNCDIQTIREMIQEVGATI